MRLTPTEIVYQQILRDTELYQNVKETSQKEDHQGLANTLRQVFIGPEHRDYPLFEQQLISYALFCVDWERLASLVKSDINSVNSR